MTQTTKRLTPEEKAAKEEIRRIEEKAARETFLAGLPLRLLNAQALARSLGTVDVTVSNKDSGLSVSFRQSKNPYMDTTITMDSDEWNMDELERELADIKRMQDEYQARYQLARSVWSRLSDTEQSVIVEFIAHLK